MTHPTIQLHKHRDKRIRLGHPWVFSNEIDGDVAALPPGGTVDVLDHAGSFLGRGYANPRSLIAVRLLTRTRREQIDEAAFFTHRLRRALAHREAVLPGRQSLRLVHAEADGLPGLIVDRYGDYLSVQINTLGIEVRKELVQEALQQVFEPLGAVLRNDSRVREFEGLEKGRGPWFGDLPASVEIDEYGVRFQVDLLEGQKTGHFFDQADNRRFAASLCRDRTVLDVYAHDGAWALHALLGGAAHATIIDRSEDACARAESNAVLNGVGDKLLPICDEGSRALQVLATTGRTFGAVFLDPPAFAKSRKVAKRALKGYRDVNGLAMRLVEPGGLLFTSSCSFHVHENLLIEEIDRAATAQHRRAILIRRGEQSPDHPVIQSIPESRYLKSFALRIE